MTNSISDIADNSGCIFVIGSNTTEQHPVFGAMLRQAVLRGAKLIVADPRRIELTDYADLHLRQRPGTDIALLNGLMYIILEKGWQVDNIDTTIVAIQPKLRKYIARMRKQLCQTLGIEIDRVSVKASTSNGLGFEGRGEGIAAQAVALISYGEK